MTRVFPDFHREFRESVPLNFSKDLGGEFRPEDIKKFYVDIRARLNLAISGKRSRVSGNGKGALSDMLNNPRNAPTTEEGCFMGGDGGISTHDEEETRAVGDDRYRFCKNSICLGYFWCILDQLGLTQEACSNVSKIGSSSTDSSIASHKNRAKRKLGVAKEIAEIMRAIEGMQKVFTASRALNQLNDRVLICRDDLSSANETLRSVRSHLLEVTRNKMKMKIFGADDETLRGLEEMEEEVKTDINDAKLNVTRAAKDLIDAQETLFAYNEKGGSNNKKAGDCIPTQRRSAKKTRKEL